MGHYIVSTIPWLIPTRRKDEAILSARRDYALNYIGLLNRFGETDIIFLDKFGCNIIMRQKKGQSSRGSKAVSVVPALHRMCFYVGKWHFKLQNKN